MTTDGIFSVAEPLQHSSGTDAGEIPVRLCIGSCGSVRTRRKKVLIRKATGEEMLQLWGCRDARHASPTAKFFYQSISAGNAVFYALDRGGELIGELYAFLDIEEDRDFADGKITAYLCAFRVKKEARGQGLGSRLMEAALADLKSLGFRRVTIGASEERNKKLYYRLGFTEKIKDCFFDPCARDAEMRPEPDTDGYWLLSKVL